MKIIETSSNSVRHQYKLITKIIMYLRNKNKSSNSKFER